MHLALVHRDLHQITRGGICTVYRSLAERYITRGHQVTLLTQQSPCPPRIDGVQIVTLPRTDDLDSHRDRVVGALTAIRADVVDSSTWEAETLHYLDRTARAPVVVRGDLSAATMDAPELATAEQKILERADRVIAVSEFAAGDLATAYGIPRPQVVANGIDRRRFTPGRSTPPQSGYRVTLDADGRVESRTPIRELLATGRPVPPWTPDPHGRLRLVWVGKITPMKGWDLLEQLVTSLDELIQLTVLLGHAPAFCPVDPTVLARLTILQDLDDDDLASFYRAADYLLSTSRWEGFGLAIAEALACGTPALLPDRLGTGAELLTDGAGLTFRDIEHLAELLNDRPLLTGRLPAQFDWDTNAEESLAIYRQFTAA